jgi:hypothetical protein
VHCKLSKSNIFPSVIQLMEPEALASLESFIEDLGRFTDWGRLPKLSTAWRSFGDHKLSSQAAFLAVDGGDARISQRASQYQMRTSQNQMRSAKKTDNIEYTGSFTSDTGMLGTLGTLDKVWGPLTYSWGTCATPVFFGPVSV